MHLVIVKPNTVIRWHRHGFRYYWRWKSRATPGRPPITAEVIALIRRMSTENPFAERVIGSIRGECTDHLVPLNETHPRKVLGEYVGYFNRSRCHQSLEGNSPEPRELQNGDGSVYAIPHLGGLRHRYTRAA